VDEGRRAVAAEERRGRRRGEEVRRAVATEERRAGGGGESGRAAASGTEMRVGDGDAPRGRGGRASARPSSPTAGDGTACVSGRSGAARRRRGARLGRARRGEAGGEDRCVEEERRDLGENG
jgi:hypothetical protein